jgi:pimeloyl-ACP methyl ester carboxylesterase
VASVHLLDVGAQASSRGPVLGASVRLVPLITRLPGGRGFVRGRFLRELRASSANVAWLDERTACAYVEPVLDAIGRAVAAALRLATAEEPEPVEGVLARVRAPVVVLLGETRAAAGPSAAELAALALLPTPARVERVPGAAHFPHEEAPDAVVRLLLADDVRVVAHRAGDGR